jgi:uncharacterized protein (TIGR03437 family)
MKRLLILLLVLAQPLAWGADCTRTSTGFTPLNDPFFSTYQGVVGGLYPDRSNQRPPAHEALGMQLAAGVQPRSASGNVDLQNGKIVFLSVGMSNTTEEFSTFHALADLDADKNPSVVIVDGAQSGWSADRIVADPQTYWAGVAQRLAASGVTAAQVETAWVKLADASPTLAFPDDARQLQSEMRTIVESLPARFPNLKLAYFSSRIYAGYATTTLNPEPYAYQSGFAVRWLIEEQINGSAELSPQSGRAPWLSWGPYLWADGTRQRFDGLAWNCADLADDGTHPSVLGQIKVALMLLNDLKTDPTARAWFVRRPAQPPPVPFAAAIVNAATYGPQMAPGSIATIFGTDLAPGVAPALTLPLPTSLAGTRVEIGGIPAPLFYVSPTQINLLLPEASSDMKTVVIRDDRVSNPLSPQMQLWAPGLFTLDASTGGPVAALHVGGRLVTAANPARPGERIEIYGTGWGVQNPLLLIPIALPIVQIGGMTAPVAFEGVAPGFPGLSQVNVTVPANAPSGAAVPIVISFGSFTSNTATIAIGLAP